MVDLSAYPNHFAYSNRYKRLLFRPSTGLQSREMNEAYDTVMAEVNRIAQTLHNDGSLISGGVPKFKVLDDGTRRLNISASVLYAHGYTHDVGATVFTFGPHETVGVGILVTESVVTEQDDPDLKDPSVGTRNYNQPGAHRLRVSTQWKKSSDISAEQLPLFYSIYTIEDGQFTSLVGENPEFAGLNQRLGKYDQDSNGSYVVEGFQATFLRNDNSAQQHILSISEGNAHVDGQIVEYDTARQAFVDYALDTHSVNNEPLQFTTDKFYSLRNGPIATVGEISAQKVATRTITKSGFANSQELLPLTPVVSIVEVKQGATTYVAGTDYIQNGDYISWAPGGAEPANGSSYTVKFIYQTVVTPIISDNRRMIYLDGINPGSTVTVDYEYYIPRIDRLVVTRDGQISLLKGVPDNVAPVAPPNNVGLSLGTVYVAYGVRPKITMDFFRVFRMSDINKLNQRVDNLDYNVSQLVLRETVRGTSPEVTKKNIFTDPFTSIDQRDAGVGQNAISTDGALEAAVISRDYLIANDVYRQVARDPSNPKRRMVSQIGRTGNRLVNEFEAVPVPPGTMTVKPANYKWTTTEITNLDVGLVFDEASQKWRDQSGNMFSYYREILNPDQSALDANGDPVRATTETGTVVTGKNIPDKLDVLQNATYYIPQIPVTIRAEKFNGGETVRITFDGIVIGNTTASAAGPAGRVDYTFTVPANIPSGTKEIVATGLTSGVVARASFTGTPSIRFKVNGEVRLATQNPLAIKWYDPLAQTFTPETDFNCPGVTLMFSNTTTSWVDMFICETTNGYPNTDRVLASKRLYGDQIFVTDGLDGPNPPTYFEFDQPIYLNAGIEYAIVMMTPDNNLLTQIAKLGDYDQNAKRWMTTQPYPRGVLFTSSNARAWTPVQDQDLRFIVHGCDFLTTDPGWTQIGQVNITNAAAITDAVLLTNVDLQQNTKAEFKLVFVANSNAEIKVYPGVPVIFPAYSGQVRILARLTTRQQKYTPTLSGDIVLSVGSVQLPMVYVTREFAIDGTNFKGYATNYEPQGTAFNLFYESNPVDLVSSVNNEWIKYALDKTTDIGTYQYRGNALTGNRPSVVTINGTNGVERDWASRKRLNPYDYFFTDKDDTLSGFYLSVQMPVVALDANWVQSTAQPNEWYYSLPVPTALPSRVVAGGTPANWAAGTELTAGTVGSLAQGQFAFGTNDGQGSPRLYIRLPTAQVLNGITNPNDATYPDGFLRYSISPETYANGYIRASQWMAFTRSSVTPLEDGLVEVEYSGTGIALDDTRLRFEGTSDNPSKRPFSTGFRSYFS